MFFSARIQLKPLAGLCRRLATALGAGIDVRTIWAREADRASGLIGRRRMAEVRESIDQGESVTAALAASGDFFPPLFRELVEVGEQTGHLSEVFGQLAEHYENQVQLRRTFLTAIAWPLIQLGMAILIIGFLIWIMGVIGGMDPFGIGVGTAGLINYVAILAVVGVVILLLVRSAGRGVFWIKPIQRAVLRVPMLGGVVQTLALARLAWSLHLTMKVGMEVRRALRLSLRSTRNALYTDQIPAIDAQIMGGSSIYEAFLQEGDYPADFLDTLAVGEQSGKIVESMGRLSLQYQERARAALVTLNMLAGVAVWCVIAAVIIALIFQLFTKLYLGPINEAMQQLGSR